MDNAGGIVYAVALDGKGGGEEVSRSELHAKQLSEHLLWVHMDREGTEGRRWLIDESGLDRFVCNALYESVEVSMERWISEARPATIVFDEGVIINLRGANLNPGATPSDMVVVRLWISQEVVVSVRHRHLMAIDDIRASIVDGQGPRGPSDFIIMLAERLLARMGPTLGSFQKLMDDMEKHIVPNRSAELGDQIGELRRDIIEWKRHIAPQREALLSLTTANVPWLSKHDQARLGNLINDVIRHLEDLDSVRERAAIIQDEISNQLSGQMTRTMYRLSIVAAIFLPLGFITGVLSMNLADTPIGTSTVAFWAVCISLFAIGVIATVIFRRL